MRINTVAVLVLILSLFLTGCGSTLIAYQPSEKMSFKAASALVDELIMGNENKYKPDSLAINESYISWGMGTDSATRGGIFTMSTTSHVIGERIYFKSINKIELYLKRRNYIVQIQSKDIDRNVLATPDINEAKRLINALESLILASKSAPEGQSTDIPSEQGKPVNADTGSTAQKLRELQALKNDGLITDKEYQQKRKEMLEHF